MLILTDAEVDALVTPADALALAAEAYRLHASKRLPGPARVALKQAAPPGGALVLAGLGGADLVVKSNIHGWPHGPDAPRRTASLLALWDMRTALPRALLASAAFNDHRTAGGLAAAARLLAPPGARRLALFGAGKIARAALRAMAAAFPLEEVRIASRGPARATELAVAEQGAAPVVRAVADPTEAARHADILLCATSSDSAVFPGDVVRDGALVLLAGATRGDAREADDAIMRRATVWADDTTDALEKGGDIRLALASGTLDPGRWRGEIGLLDAPPPADGRIRVFKSIGIAAQDLLLARHVVALAEARGIGLRHRMFEAWDAP
ncbi:ornithine cyclodeaminase family protein [Falsiroseomonas oryziterrae]|uniref:ornithine cyclodeaminase family protein n=1 Tax=Falsiroseomonas oryziterrae TaxID=2911368 RepID=UPI001F3EF393|nr:NAD(P)-binding domain-containing protein [Roseomonas sp. NPKOSM-4]